MTTNSFLRDHQYRNAVNLNARIQIHARFSTNPYNWYQWVLDHFDLPPQARLLELGCGQGNLWLYNRGRYPAGWQVTLSDFSPGMLDDARTNLAGGHFAFEVINAEDIPLDDASLDAVIANHMIYHIPDRPRALGEIRRVLKPGGKLYAATNGDDHMDELYTLSEQAGIDLRERRLTLGVFNFNLFNGSAQLAAHFAAVERHDYADELVITEAEPLVDYILSMQSAIGIATPEQIECLQRLLESEIAAHGAIRIHKSTGLFIASV
jgi:ubiquinone/menaquinone biosynthesis C-methylase UbiE